MTRKILVNGLRAEEMRVAIVDNRVLENFEIETKHSGLSRNNIYRGVVANIAPSLNAAFVDFGEGKNGFLAFNDVVESAYNKPLRDGTHGTISDVLVAGQPLLVQVIKDAAGSKGAQLTTNLSIAGRYLVLRPKDSKSGISRKVDDDARVDLAAKVKSLDLPDGIGCIVRTNALDQPRAVLLRDAKALLQLWRKIEAEAERCKTTCLLYNDHDIVVQVLRDYFDASVEEVLIDCEESYQRALAYVHATMPALESRIKLYSDRVPLFSKFTIEKQIDQIFDRRVHLPSGGFIVIDPTEALTAIDVNSAKSTKRDTQDLTAYHTNLEAAAEIARQLRMRDIGGLIVVDFIDMRIGKHQRDVERAMRNAMSRDKARNRCERISANGLMEINRQRISQALTTRMHFACPTCNGKGFIPNIEMLGLNLIRSIEARAVDGKIGGARIRLHPDIAESVQNQRRHDIVQLEMEFNIQIEIVADREISRSEEAIEWLPKVQEVRHEVRHAAMSVVDTAPELDEDDGFPKLKRSFTEDDEDLKELDYRPNDYEAFASPEARERRLKRRRTSDAEDDVEANGRENGEAKDEEQEDNGDRRRRKPSRRNNGVKRVEKKSEKVEKEDNRERRKRRPAIGAMDDEQREEKAAQEIKDANVQDDEGDKAKERSRRRSNAREKINAETPREEESRDEEVSTKLPFSAREYMKGSKVMEEPANKADDKKDARSGRKPITERVRKRSTSKRSLRFKEAFETRTFEPEQWEVVEVEVPILPMEAPIELEETNETVEKTPNTRRPRRRVAIHESRKSTEEKVGKNAVEEVEEREVKEETPEKETRRRRTRRPKLSEVALTKEVPTETEAKKNAKAKKEETAKEVETSDKPEKTDKAKPKTARRQTRAKISAKEEGEVQVDADKDEAKPARKPRAKVEKAETDKEDAKTARRSRAKVEKADADKEDAKPARRSRAKVEKADADKEEAKPTKNSKAKADEAESTKEEKKPVRRTTRRASIKADVPKDDAKAEKSAAKKSSAKEEASVEIKEGANVEKGTTKKASSKDDVKKSSAKAKKDDEKKEDAPKRTRRAKSADNADSKAESKEKATARAEEEPKRVRRTKRTPI